MMGGSFERINYALRPAKQIERKMICETIRRLSVFASTESYRYVGFGSINFSDFALFHRRLNMSNLIGIEKDDDKSSRFEFNKPFDCIEIRFGHSTAVLSELDWSQRSVFWLDYDGKLNSDVLTDVTSFCANAVSGSMLVVSVNAQIPTDARDRVKKLGTAVGAEKVPVNLQERDLGGWNTARTYRRIISNVIVDQIRKRNGGLPECNQMMWRQVLNFEYADGAKMMTVGGLIFDRGQEPHYHKCAFTNLEFVRTGDDGYRIDVPMLTYRELRYLDKQLPCAAPDDIEASGIRTEDIEAYRKVYRYFPTFAEADL